MAHYRPFKTASQDSGETSRSARICRCRPEVQRLQLDRGLMESAPGSIDTRNILSVCHSGDTVDHELLREMLGYFIDENERRIVGSQEAVVSGDRESLRQLAHAMRGSAAMLGAGRLHDLAWSLEMDADRHDLQLLARSVNTLRLELDAVVTALRRTHPEACAPAKPGLL
jgi:HPt (histidine-containing phosphotransfer) domain-containing protein